MYTLLINLDELWLKLGKRPYYMKAIKEHIQLTLNKHGYSGVCIVMENQRYLLQSDIHFSDELIDALLLLPGINSLARVEKIPRDYDALFLTVSRSLEEYAERSFTFAVRTHRADKQYEHTSMMVSREIGHHVLESFPGAKVDLFNPDLWVDIKITKEFMYVAKDIKKGIGGLPAGTSSHVVSLLSGGFDSPVASYLMAKRGCQLSLVFFHAYPFVGNEVKKKIERIAKRLSGFQRTMNLYIVPFGPLQKEIVRYCKPAYRTFLFRHYMIATADLLAYRLKAKALCTGDALSQVASQTMESIAILDEACRRPLLRPLIGFNKVDIIALARKIGTYELSVEDQDDACRMMAPSNPVVRPYHPYWKYFTMNYDWDDMMNQALDSAEIVSF